MGRGGAACRRIERSNHARLPVRAEPVEALRTEEALFAYHVRTVQYNLDRISRRNSCWGAVRGCAARTAEIGGLSR